MNYKCELCGDPQFARMLCKYHYLKRWKGSYKEKVALGKVKELPCKVCGKPQMAKRLCQSHYTRQWYAARRVPCINGRQKHEWLGDSNCRVCGTERK